MSVVKIINNPFDKKSETRKIHRKLCICEAVKDIDYNNALIYVNGTLRDKNYKLNSKDVCVIRQYPSASVSVGAIVALSFLTFAITDVVVEAVTGKTIGEHALNSILTPQINNNDNKNVSITQLPTLAGSRNQSALGKAIPLILGRTYFAPYILGKPYTTISGEDGCEETYHCLYLIGYKNLKIENVCIGLETLATNEDDIENGTIPLIEDCKYPTAQLELKQNDEEVSLYDCKVVQKNLNIELTNVEGTPLEAYEFSARYPKVVELEFTFQGLLGFDEKGNVTGAEANIKVEYSFNGTDWIVAGNVNGDRWEVENATGTHIYDNGVMKFENQQSKTLRYVYRRVFTYNEMANCDTKVVTFRITRTNANSTSTNVVDKSYFTAIRTWCYDATKTKKWADEHSSETTHPLINQIPMNERERDKTARLGFSIKVTKDLVDYFDQINLIATSKARTWDGNGWSKELDATRNPASLALMVMTADYRAPYCYNLEEDTTYMKSNKIDLQQFGELYEYCNEVKYTNFAENRNRFYCDGAVVNATKTIDLVNTILQTARSFLVLNGKKYGIFTDKPLDLPLLTLNNNNLLSLTLSKTFDELPDGQKVKYVDAMNFYQQDTIDVKPYSENNNEVLSTDVLENVEYPYITDPYHAKAMSLYQQACRKLRPETLLAKVSTEGGLAEIGSLINVQSPVINVGIGEGAEIVSLIIEDFEITGIVVDSKFTVTDYTRDYGVVINEVDRITGQPVVIKKKLARFDRNGNYNHLIFDSPESTDVLEEGDIVSFGFYGTEVFETICLGKKENGNGTYDLTLVPYDEDIYIADEYIIDDFDPKVTPPSESGLPISFGDRSVPVTKAEILDTIDNIDFGAEYTCSLSMASIGSGVSGNVYKSGSIATETLYYADFYGTQGNPPTSVGATGTVTNGIINISAVNNADKHLVNIYSDSARTNLLCSAFVSYGAGSTSYWLITNTSSVKKDREGNITPSAITLTAKKQTGTSSPSNYTGRIGIAVSTNGSTYGTETYYNVATQSFTIPANAKLIRCRLYMAGGTTYLLDEDIVSVVEDGQNGGYQDYQFAVGDFGLTDQQARQLTWYDAPPTVGVGQCLYMATKFIEGE